MSNALAIENSRIFTRNRQRAADFPIDEFEHRLHRVVWEADLRQALVQALCAGIAPAAFGHERIPHFDLILDVDHDDLFHCIPTVSDVKKTGHFDGATLLGGCIDARNVHLRGIP